MYECFLKLPLIVCMKSSTHHDSYIITRQRILYNNARATVKVFLEFLVCVVLFLDILSSGSTKLGNHPWHYPNINAMLQAV